MARRMDEHHLVSDDFSDGDALHPVDEAGNLTWESSVSAWRG